MSDDKPKTWGETFRWLVWGSAKYAAGAAAGTALGVALTLIVGVAPQQVIETQVREVAAPIGDYVAAFGWHRDEAAIARNLNPAITTQFDATPAGRAVMGAEEDVFLWRAIQKASGKPPAWVNQGPVGCCVAAANKHVVDVLQAVQIASGKPGEWKPIAVEPSYSLSRVEIGGGRISGDGSVGAWIVKADQDFGVIPMEKIGEHDLSVYSPSRARAWGRSGCPDDLEPKAREHPVKGVALVKSPADVERAIRQGYPILVCSDQGFRMERDSDGKCSPQGIWYHAMAIIGVRVSAGKTLFFVVNSWGDKAHTGPVWPEDMPVEGFWADAAVIDRMVRQGDSHALSDVKGFPARELPLNWFLAAPVPQHAHNHALARFNLKVLAW